MTHTLRQLRARAYLTTRELANKAGVSPVTLWRIEQGKHKPHVSTMRKIADVLEVHPSEIAEFAQEAETGARE